MHTLSRKEKRSIQERREDLEELIISFHTPWPADPIRSDAEI
jgi:hypothetical protein